MFSFNTYSILQPLSTYFCQGLFNQTFATGFLTGWGGEGGEGTQIRSLSKYKKKKKESENYKVSLGAENRLNLLQMLTRIGPVQFEAMNIYFPSFPSNHPTCTEKPNVNRISWVENF